MDGTTNNDHDPDFESFWRQLKAEEKPSTVVHIWERGVLDDKFIRCNAISAKRQKYWDMAIEAGFTFDDLHSLLEKHNSRIASPNLSLHTNVGEEGLLMNVDEVNLTLHGNDQIGEEDKQLIRLLFHLASKSLMEPTVALRPTFVEMEAWHDIPFVAEAVCFLGCNLSGCDELMSNIVKHARSVSFSGSILPNGGADVRKWLPSSNCRLSQLLFTDTYVDCDNLAWILRSRKQINKISVTLSPVQCPGGYDQEAPEEYINTATKLLSDAGHLQHVGVILFYDHRSDNTWADKFDYILSLLGKKNLLSLTCTSLEANSGHSQGIVGAPCAETLSQRREALRGALEGSHELTHLDLDPCPIDELEYDAIVEPFLERNRRSKVTAVLRSMSTWSRPMALFGAMIALEEWRYYVCRRFDCLLVGSEVLKRAWDEGKAAVRAVGPQRNPEFARMRSAPMLTESPMPTRSTERRPQEANARTITQETGTHEDATIASLGIRRKEEYVRG